MQAEIIAIGTELLMGEIINRNAAWISKKPAELGIDVYHDDENIYYNNTAIAVKKDGIRLFLSINT